MDLEDVNISSGIENSNADQQSAWVIESIVDDANTPPPSNPRIPRVPAMVKETRDYEKYYVPKLVSIGPYHHGDPKLKFVENLKSAFTMKLLSESSVTLKSLYEILGEPTMVKKLRDFYEEKSTDGFPDKAFTKMMILDGCFILYYIKSIYYENAVETCPLNSHQIVFVHQDLFLLENQIPFQVLTEVMKLKNIEWRETIKLFIYEHFLTSDRQTPGFFSCSRKSKIPYNDERFGEEEEDYFNFRVDHLLQFLHHTLIPREYLVSNYNSKKRNLSDHTIRTKKVVYRCSFRNVNELIDVGIRFKPSNAMHLAEICYLRRWWWFSADVELPPITVDDSTKPMLLNLIAHEMCSDDDGRDAWVTSYVCLLDSLIDSHENAEDVKSLSKAGVLDISVLSDDEVAKLFNEIGTDLVPNVAAYSEAKYNIQKHYDSLRYARLTQLKHEYLKSALLGAVLAFVLSVIQTFFSVWSPKGECDDLCKFLKKNHHL